MNHTIPARRLFLAAIAGGLVLFLWAFAAWMLLPLRMSAIRTLPDEKTVIASMQNAPRGVYFFGAGAQGAPGPQGLLVYSPSAPAMSGGQLVRSLLFDILSALFVAWLLSRAAAASFGARVAFVMIAGGVIAAMVVDLPNWNWFAYPLDFTIMSALDKVIGWTLAGLALAAIVRPRRVEAAA
jgi:hypothetical protein